MRERWLNHPPACTCVECTNKRLGRRHRAERERREREERVRQRQEAQRRVEREREERLRQEIDHELLRQEESVSQQQEVQQRADREREEGRIRRQREAQRRVERLGSGPRLAPGSRPEDLSAFERSFKRRGRRFAFGNVLGVSFFVGVAILTGAVSGVLLIYPILPDAAVEVATDMQQWVGRVFGR